MNVQAGYSECVLAQVADELEVEEQTHTYTKTLNTAV